MSVRRSFYPHPSAAAAARRFVAESVPDAGRDELVLVASELVTNAIQHAGTRFTVALTVTARQVRVEVSDQSAAMPSSDGLTEPTAGLRIVDALATRWGAERTKHGKTVWADLLLPRAEPECPSDRRVEGAPEPAPPPPKPPQPLPDPLPGPPEPPDPPSPPDPPGGPVRHAASVALWR